MDTLRDNLIATITVFKRVFGKFRYTSFALVVFFITLSGVLLLPNLDLISQTVVSAVSVNHKLALVVSLYGSLFTNYSLISATYTVVLLALFSINTTLLFFYIRRVQKSAPGTKRAHTSGVVGVISGVLGIGCAACGSVILTGLTTSMGATGLLLALPLRGGEFALLGILFLAISISFLVGKIGSPLVCPAKC